MYHLYNDIDTELALYEPFVVCILITHHDMRTIESCLQWPKIPPYVQELVRLRLCRHLQLPGTILYVAVFLAS